MLRLKYISELSLLVCVLKELRTYKCLCLPVVSKVLIPTVQDKYTDLFLKNKKDGKIYNVVLLQPFLLILSHQSLMYLL